MRASQPARILRARHAPRFSQPSGPVRASGDPRVCLYQPSQWTLPCCVASFAVFRPTLR